MPRKGVISEREGESVGDCADAEGRGEKVVSSMKAKTRL